MLRPAAKHLRRPGKISFVRITVLTIALSAALVTLSRVYSVAQPTIRTAVPDNHKKALVRAASALRAAKLRDALRAWNSGPLPAEVGVLAAECPPADAAGAALRQTDGPPDVVIDVGANQGHPVTLGALQRRARLVLSVEPDPRNFGRLTHRANSVIKTQPGRTRRSRFVGVDGAAGAETAVKRMLFHKTRNDFSCFTCLDVRKAEIFAKDVKVTTVDKLLARAGVASDAEIALLKTDTQGFELEVLTGAAGAFANRQIAAVLVEFDPKLLRTREIGLGVLDKLVGYGMQCVHLAFSGRKSAVEEKPRFPELPISAENRGRFYDFVVAQGGWTDVFCLRPPPS